MSNRETAREAPNPRAQLPRRNYGNWSAALASFARCKPRHCTNQRLAARSSRAAHSPWARPTRWAFKALGSPTHNEDVRASTMLPSLLQHQSHAQTRVPQAAARDCHVLRGLPPRALVPELGDNGDCVLHEGYRCVLAQRRRPLSAGCRRHRLLRRWARDGAGMDIGQALLRIPTVETGGNMLFGRALSRLRRPTVRNAGAWRQPHRISSTSKSSSFLATKRPPGAVRRATAWSAEPSDLHMPLLSPQLSQRLPYLGLRSIRLRRSLRNARRQTCSPGSPVWYIDPCHESSLRP